MPDNPASFFRNEGKTEVLFQTQIVDELTDWLSGKCLIEQMPNLGMAGRPLVANLHAGYD